MKDFNRFIGIDIHKKTMTWVALDGKKREVGSGQMPMKLLESWGKETLGSGDRVVIEATGNSRHVYGVLSGYAGEVVVANPLAMHDRTKAKRKTDRVDARALAEALASDYVKAVWVPDEETRLRREWAAHRKGLSEQLTRTRNQLRACLYRHGKDYAGRDILDRKASEEVERGDLPDLVQRVFLSHWRVGVSLREEIDRLDGEFSRESLRDDRCLRLMTLPGVQAQAAMIITSAVGCIERFPSPKKLAAYSGLVPSVSRSDETVRYGRITKQGRSLLRWIMVEAAHAAVLTPGPLQDRHQRLLRRGKKPQEAVVAVARHMLELVWVILKKKTVFQHARKTYLTYKFRSVLRKAYGRCPQGAAPTLMNAVMGWKPGPTASP